VQRPDDLAFARLLVGGIGRGACTLGVYLDEAAELVVQPGDPVEAGFDNVA